MGYPRVAFWEVFLYNLNQNDLHEAMSQSDAGQQEADSDSVIMMTTLQTRVDHIISWLKDNQLVVAPSKSKLLVSITKDLRQRRYKDINVSIKVGEKVIYLTPSEKLHGIIYSEDITWKPYPWGDVWIEDGNWISLMPQLLQRLGRL